MNTMPRRSPIRNYFDASHGGSNKGTPKEKVRIARDIGVGVVTEREREKRRSERDSTGCG